MIPTPRLLWAVLATSPLAVAPLVLEPTWPLPIAIWVILAVLVSVDAAILGAARPQLSVKRPQVAGVGAPFRVQVRIESPTFTKLRSELRAITTRPLATPELATPRVGGGALDVPVELCADRRGEARLAQLWLRTFGLFGLLSRIDSSSEGCGPIAVLPDVERVDRATMAVVGAQPMLTGMKREKWTGEGGEFESLQSYTLGMDLRAVDWKASARHQALRVRRFHIERRQRIVLCLDVGREMRDPIDGLERLDHGVHTALVLGRAALRAGDLVGLHAYGSEPTAWVPPRGGVGQLARLRGACARLASEADETNHVLGLHDLLRRVNRRSMIVVFTEFTDATTAELMLDALGQLAHRHVIVFVALDDPLLEEPLSNVPDSTQALASAVVAGSLRDRRHLVLARLSRLGVHVVHTKPGAVAGELVERYVRIKSRGLIG